MKILLLDRDHAAWWRRLVPEAEVVTPELPRGCRLAELSPDQSMDPERCIELARDLSAGFDLVVGEQTAGFLWHALFRLVGDVTPFLLVPRFNHVMAVHAWPLLLASRLARGNERILAGSSAAARSFASFGFAADPLYVPGIDPRVYRRLPESRRKIRESLGVPTAREVILYVGRMEEDKNVLELLTAFAAIRPERDVELVICHRFGRDEYLSLCRRRAQDIGRVRFVHDPERARLIRWYNAADLFATAAVSLFETFGRAPVEAMACGTPAVTPAYDGFRETVISDAGFQVPTVQQGIRKWPDVEGLATTLAAALADRPGLREKRRAGIERAADFDEEATGRALRERIESLVAEAPSPASGPERFSLDGLSPAVAELWGPFEGEPLHELLGGFLASGRPPFSQPPPRAAVHDFYRGWFEHY